MACIGFILLGFGVGIMRAIDLGVDPFGALAVGLSNLTGLSFGTVLVLMHSPFFVLMLCKMRRTIGVGTVLGMIIIGYIVDFFYFMTSIAPIEFMELGLVVRLFLLLITLFIFSFGIAMYIVADIGIVPYDSFGVIMENMTGGKVKFKWARLSADGLCALAAFLLGATLGIATILTVFCLGPLISFFRRHIKTRLGNPT